MVSLSGRDTTAVTDEECEYLGKFLDAKTVQRIAHGELDPREYEKELRQEEERKVGEEEERVRRKEAKKREESEKSADPR
jgi:hypothetical protein